MSVDAVRPVFAVFGGLGNQLFQYSAGLYAEKIWGLPVDFHYFETATRASKNPRSLLLNRFSISKTIVPISALMRTVYYGSRLQASVPWVHALLGFQVIREQEPHSPDMRLFLKPSVPTFYFGYWQVKSYVDVVEKKLREDLVFDRHLSASAQKVRDCIIQRPLTVAVHVRRGDDAESGSGRRCLPIAYYEHAVRAYRRLSSDVRFFVFSDDSHWALQNALFRSADMVVHEGSQALAHEDLFLMSLCTHQVIANSTLSWWAAWLNGHPDKQVTMPPFWSQGEPVPPTLLLADRCA